VGVVDELAGGAGMTKPAIVPKPPALFEEAPVPKASKAVPIPEPKIAEPAHTLNEAQNLLEAAEPPVKETAVAQPKPEPMMIPEPIAEMHKPEPIVDRADEPAAKPLGEIKHEHPMTPAVAEKVCPSCGQPLKWIEKYQRHYCYNCRKYAPKDPVATPIVATKKMAAGVRGARIDCG
jgi:hypothetical protein